MEWITTTDIHILFGLHRLAGPHMDAFITYFTTVINTLWLWAILAAAGLWKRRSRWVTLTIIVAVILAILVGDVAIKHFVMRIRPYLVIPGAPTLDTLKYPISYSFPSGHSFFFFAGATVLFRSCRRLGHSGLRPGLCRRLFPYVPVHAFPQRRPDRCRPGYYHRKYCLADMRVCQKAAVLLRQPLFTLVVQD